MVNGRTDVPHGDKASCIYLRNIDRKLHDRFKESAAYNGESMTAAMLRMMKQYVKKTKKARKLAEGE